MNLLKTSVLLSYIYEKCHSKWTPVEVNIVYSVKYVLYFNIFYLAGFLICWMAFFTGYFLTIYAGMNHPLLIILTTFYYWNSIANPVLFFIYHRKKVRAASRPTWQSTEETSHLQYKSTVDTCVKDEADTSVSMIVKEEQ